MSTTDNKERIEQLIAIFHDPTGRDQSEEKGFAAAYEVAKFKEEAILPLLAALRNDESIVRGHAALALGLIGDTRAVFSLISMLLDEDYIVKGYASDAIGNINDKKAIPYLIKLLDIPDPAILIDVVRVLRKLKAYEAKEILLTLLDKTKFSLDIYDTKYMSGNAKAIDNLELLPDYTIGYIVIDLDRLKNHLEKTITEFEQAN